MEAQPTFAQLYINIDRIGPGGITSKRQNQPAGLSEDQDPAKRNLFVTFKSFPTLEKLVTSI